MVFDALCFHGQNVPEGNSSSILYLSFGSFKVLENLVGEYIRSRHRQDSYRNERIARRNSVRVHTRKQKGFVVVLVGHSNLKLPKKSNVKSEVGSNGLVLVFGRHQLQTSSHDRAAEG
jgi:hypothetical protein